MLKKIDADPIGYGVRLDATPARARLKRLGYIVSRRPNEGRINSRAGKSYSWRMTEAGRQRFEGGEHG